ncbi:MAG: DnaD domain protein [Halanaerobiales bacterium]|nr:DnaD domain protein [Halanaerobiales bacterium]
MQHLKYFKVPKVIFKDDKLNFEEFHILVKLFSKVDQSQLISKSQWKTKKSFFENNTNLIDSLQEKKWLIKEENNLYLTVPEEFQEELNDQEFQEAGSKIAAKWDEYFGTLNLTPTFLQKLLSFMEDGITEEVIIEVMKISAEKAKGNPTNYIISLLRDYLNRSIYTIHDFKEEKQRMEEYEKRLQEINRKKEKRDEEETLEDFYKKGYR